MRDDSDESLMLRYKEGEVRAFEVLMTRHRAPVYRFVLRFVGPTQAEDVLQETFMRVIKSAASYERQAKFTTWLYTIARNLCVDAGRRAKHRRVQSLDASANGDPDGTPLVEMTSDGKAHAETDSLNLELQMRIRAAIDALPDEQREIFLLRESADLQFNEIARIVGCPENTVKSRMRYALEKLREALADYRDAAQLPAETVTGTGTVTR